MAYRLFSPQDLFPDAILFLGGNQAHYLVNVLRLSPSDSFHVFNGTDGEWRAVVLTKHKKGIEARLQERMVPPKPQLFDLFLFFAPLKAHRLGWLLEKATEMGVTHFIPCRTEHTSVRQINTERLERITLEPTEQSGRLHPPLFWPLATLTEHLENWKAQYPKAPLFFCDVEEKKSLSEALNPFELLPLPQAALTIGPEGGWSQTERQLLKERFSQTIPVSLGKTILRAETAALLGAGMIRLCQEKKDENIRGKAFQQSPIEATS